MVGVNLEPLDPVVVFPYLGHMFSYNNRDWATLHHNLHKARRQWEMVEKVVPKTGEMVWASVMLYKSVVKSLLLYRSESWLVMGLMIKVIEGFFHRVARRIKGVTAQRTTVGKCKFPLVTEALETVGIYPIKKYIQQRQDTASVQVACRPIYKLCTGADRIPEMSKVMQCWEQDFGWEVE